MTKNLPALPDQDKRIAEALRLHQIVLASAAQMAVAAAKAGLEFKAIKKTLGHSNWEPFFQHHFAKSITLRTAQRYMALADGLKGKALKNDTGVSFLPLLEQAPSKLSEKDQEKLTKAVSKMTDGATLSELYQDFGIVKKPQGAGAKGGNTRKPTETAATADEPTPAVETESKIPKGWEERAYRLNTLLVEALKDNWWNECNEEQRGELHGNLLDAQGRVAALLKGKK